MLLAVKSRRIKRMPRSVMLLAMLWPAAAGAADLPSRADEPAYVPTPLPTFSWTGVYAGASAGGGFSTGNAFNNYLGTSGGKAKGILGGAQVGYNYQVSRTFVVGIENDFLATGISTGNNSNPYVSLPFFGTGRARAGIALMDSRLLLYGTAGMGFGQIDDANVKKLRVGWTAGGGAEYALSDRWSVKVEGLYTDLFKGLQSNTWPGQHAKFISGRIGLNYHFDLFRSAAVVDAY